MGARRKLVSAIPFAAGRKFHVEIVQPIGEIAAEFGHLPLIENDPGLNIVPLDPGCFLALRVLPFLCLRLSLRRLGAEHFEHTAEPRIAVSR